MAKSMQMGCVFVLNNKLSTVYKRPISSKSLKSAAEYIYKIFGPGYLSSMLIAITHVGRNLCM